MATPDEILAAADQRHLTEILGARTPEEVALLMSEYYRDNARAERTSRSQMYLHLGLLAGWIMRMVRDQEERRYDRDERS